jgi:hypothetical protein
MAFSLALVMSAVALTADATMLLFILPSMPQTGPFLPTFACATLFITVLAWIAIWFGFWSGLCLSIISLVSALGSLFHCWISPNTILTIFTAILIIPGTVAIVVIAHRRNAFDRTNRLSATFALIPGFLSGILSGVFLDYPRVDVIMILLFTLLTPLPFAAVPLAFDWLRHR